MIDTRQCANIGSFVFTPDYYEKQSVECGVKRLVHVLENPQMLLTCSWTDRRKKMIVSELKMHNIKNDQLAFVYVFSLVGQYPIFYF